MISELESFRNELDDRGISIVEHPCRKPVPGQKCRICVLGVLLSANGIAIEQYMLSWLTEKYNVFAIRQPLPGSLFEYPALRFAQLFSIEREEPVLYLHTKGAAHQSRFQRKTLNMWRHEFVDCKSDYDDHMDDNDVLLPYSGPQNITWFNGFIASPKAFASIPPITAPENRYVLEILFKGSNLVFWGKRLTDIQKTDDLDTTSSMYRDIKFFPASYSSIVNRLFRIFNSYR